MDTIGTNAVTMGQILYWTLVITVSALLAYVVFRAMDHPRLVLTPTPQGPRARPRDVVLYAITIPVLIGLWYTFFFLVLLVANNDLNAVQLVVLPAAIVLSTRILAFVSHDAAEELAKITPFALIAIVILDGNIRSGQDMGERLEQIVQLQTSAWAEVMILFADYALTAIWYWGWIRWWQPRRAQRQQTAQRQQAALRQQVSHDDGGVAVLPDADGADGRP